MSAELVLVAAVAENGVIGAAGGLPWKVRADLKRFRAVTMGKPMIMGRRTFESIGRVLDGRDNIVVTRDRAFAAEGVLVAHSLAEAIVLAEDCATRRGAGEICVIGGAQIFEETLPRATRLDVTHIGARPEGDVFFPTIDPAVWAETARVKLIASEGDTASAENVIYKRR